MGDAWFFETWIEARLREELHFQLDLFDLQKQLLEFELCNKPLESEHILFQKKAEQPLLPVQVNLNYLE